MRTHKPRLASGDRIQVTTGAQLNSATGVVAAAPDAKTAARRVVRSVSHLALLGAGVTVATYAILAATVFVMVHTAGGGWAGVLRNTFPVGQAPIGGVMLASGEPVGHSVTDKLNQAVLGVPGASVVRVIAHPASTVKTGEDGYIVINGQPTRYQGAVAPKLLGREYLVMCIQGACKTGGAFVLPQDRLVGEVRTTYGITGLGGKQ